MSQTSLQEWIDKQYELHTKKSTPVHSADANENKNDSQSKQPNTKNNTMANNNNNTENPTSSVPPTNQRPFVDPFVYIGNLSRVLKDNYDGDPNALDSFITAIEMADSASTAEQQPELVRYIKTK